MDTLIYRTPNVTDCFTQWKWRIPSSPSGIDNDQIVNLFISEREREREKRSEEERLDFRMSLRQNVFMRRNASNVDLTLPTITRSTSHSPAPRSGNSSMSSFNDYSYSGDKSRSSKNRQNHRLIMRVALAASFISIILYFGPSMIYRYVDEDGVEDSQDSASSSIERQLERERQQIQEDFQEREKQKMQQDVLEPDILLSSADQQQQQQRPKNPCPKLQSNFGGAVNPGYFRLEDSIVAGGTSFKFVAITDLDKLSKVKDAKKPTFRADLVPGVLHFDYEDNKYSISWETKRQITTRQNEGGRGGEYSELTLFDHRLLTFDDRTGAVVELLNKPDGLSSFPVTRYVFTEGNGDTTKGMKWEWSTIKDDELYIGGIGKEMQLSNGDVDTEDAMWIAILGKHGEVRREDWSSQYNFVRKFLGCQLPGYVAHEAIRWSHHLQRWIFLPRRVSTHQYVPDLDERLGSNKVIIVNEDFTQSTVIEIDLEHHEAGLRGFSSFAFVPNTQDTHVLALRSVEEDCVHDDATCKFKTYVCVFELLSGEVLMEEILMDDPVKFEGIEFVDIFTKPPLKSAIQKLRGVAN